MNGFVGERGREVLIWLIERRLVRLFTTEMFFVLCTLKKFKFLFETSSDLNLWLKRQIVKLYFIFLNFLTKTNKSRTVKT